MKRLLLFSILGFLFLPQVQHAQDCTTFAKEHYTVKNLSYHALLADIKSTGEFVIDLTANGKIDFWVLTQAQYDEWLNDTWRDDVLLRAERINQLKNKRVSIKDSGDYAFVFSNKRSLIKSKDITVTIQICSP